MLHARPVPSRRRARARGAAALALGAAVLLAGCGGSLGEPRVEPAPEASYIVVNPDALVPESDGGLPASPSPSPSPSPSAEASGECVALQTAWRATNQALVSLSAEHPRELVHSFRTASGAMADVEPPEGVADDWATMADYLTRVNTALEDVDADDADAVGAAMSAAVTGQESQEAIDAAGRITVFVSAGCQAE